MVVSELKTDCILEANGNRIHATIHLIEIRYSERIIFWNGVAQIPEDEYGRLGDFTATSSPIGVRLPDGRTGFLDGTHFEATEGYFEFAGVGKPN